MSTKKQVFKEGDRVYLYPLGWGDIQYKSDYDYSIYFKSIEDTRYIGGDVRSLLSFTEYTLEGLSQERPEELPNEGDIVWVRNADLGIWGIGHFYKKMGDYYYVSNYVGEKEWSRRGIEITTKNPYEKSED